ncbi:DUF1501 domain-containing protein [uncultured Shimia sp.]|uniref:DUF1501 domain-containing protein n=1 Tax=uncultured Shimia sp. TaxID=573152 RepID=UPI00261F9116|nr:DUF1501 domain-containing protein [uncultured Shimia sp.]
MTHILSRRGFMMRSAAIGCSLAASPLVTPMTFASAPWDNRLVVIILRGGLDGLDAVRPWGDPDFVNARPSLATERDPALALDNYFGLHPALAPLMPLWQAGELGFVHAASQPYRDKRSHFDGQDLLEAGLASREGGLRDGWLNRMLQGVPNVTADTTYAIGREDMLLTRGAALVLRWTPEVDIGLSAQGLMLMELTMQDDPMLAQAMAQAVNLADQDGDPVVMADEQDMMEGMAADQKVLKGSKSHERIADFAAQQLRQDARITSFSIGGWDTHANQSRVLAKPLSKLADTILRLKDGVGANVWGKTTVIAMTEFGRTVRENGTKGTDHGTGGVMVLSGGALRGGKVYGRWPGLSEAALYDRRDLMPTDDVRRWAAWAMRGSFGLSRDHLERVVFPGLDLADDPNMLL